MADTVEITLRYFSIARDRLGGVDAETVALPTATDETALKAAIGARHPAIAPLLAHSRLAHNHDFCHGPVRLAAGDEVAVIPPVSGG